MPGKVADILDDPDQRGLNFTLDAQAELRYAGRRVVGVKIGEPLGKYWTCRRPPVVQLVCGLEKYTRWKPRIVVERLVGGGVVDIVPLQPLVECAEAAAKDGLAIAKEIVREADTRLKGVVIVGDQPSGIAVLAGMVDAIQIERAYRRS